MNQTQGGQTTLWANADRVKNRDGIGFEQRHPISLLLALKAWVLD